MEITSKRVIFNARTSSGKTTSHREYAIENISGVDSVTTNRFSGMSFLIGLTTFIAVATCVAWLVVWLTYGPLLPEAHEGQYMAMPQMRWAFLWVIDGLRQSWSSDIGSISIIAGLTAGFGGLALSFLLRRAYWVRPILLGISLGGFLAVALSYTFYAFALLAISAIAGVVGLAGFAWLPEVVVTLRSSEGVEVNLVRGRRFIDIFQGAALPGYIEAAPTIETEDAIREVGAIINDVKTLGTDGVEKWKV